MEMNFELFRHFRR